MASTPLNIGFLSVLQEPNGFLGGYLITNVWGRPLEFRLSSAVQPNKVQQILYAGTLVPYICGDLIGKALVDKAAVAAQLILTNCQHALDLRLKLDCPVVWLAPANEPPPTGPNVVVLLDNRGALVCHERYPQDVGTVSEMLTQIQQGIADLAEPFQRVREAIAEARKLGVSGARAAA